MTTRSLGRPNQPGAGLDHQRGFVTAELAAAMPVVVVLLVTGLFAVGAVTAQVRCVDAAREAALAAARGESDSESALRFAPPGAGLTVDTAGTQVRAEVVAPVHPLGQWLPPVHVSGAATAAIEPGEEAP